MKNFNILVICIIICLCLFFSKDCVCEKKVIKEDFNLELDVSTMNFDNLKNKIYNDVKKNIIKDINRKLNICIESVKMEDILQSIKDIHSKFFLNVGYFDKINYYLQKLNYKLNFVRRPNPDNHNGNYHDLIPFILDDEGLLRTQLFKNIIKQIDEKSYKNFYKFILSFLEKYFLIDYDTLYTDWKELIVEKFVYNQASKDDFDNIYSFKEQKLFLYFIARIPYKYELKIKDIIRIDDNDLLEITKHIISLTMIYQIHYLIRITNKIFSTKFNRNNLLHKFEKVFSYEYSNVNFFKNANFVNNNYINTYTILFDQQNPQDQILDINTSKIYDVALNTYINDYDEAFILFIYLIYLKCATDDQITEIKKELKLTNCPTPCPKNQSNQTQSIQTDNLEFLVNELVMVNKSKKIYIIQINKNKYIYIYIPIYLDTEIKRNRIYIMFYENLKNNEILINNIYTYSKDNVTFDSKKGIYSRTTIIHISSIIYDYFKKKSLADYQFVKNKYINLNIFKNLLVEIINKIINKIPNDIRNKITEDLNEIEFKDSESMKYKMNESIDNYVTNNSKDLFIFYILFSIIFEIYFKRILIELPIKNKKMFMDQDFNSKISRCSNKGCIQDYFNLSEEVYKFNNIEYNLNYVKMISDIEIRK